MNRQQLLNIYSALVLSNEPWQEFIVCAQIFNELRAGKRGSVKWAKLHLRSRAYEARKVKQQAALASL